MGDSCKKRAIVVGGGFAGLAAAAELSSHAELEVTLVEAADYLGGRVKQVQPFEGCQLLDIGGEFVHGEQTTAMRLAQQFAWDLNDLGPEKTYAFINGKLSPLNEENEMFYQAMGISDQFFECGRDIRRSFPLSKCKSDPLTKDPDDFSKEVHSNLKKDNLRDLSMKQFIDQLEDVDNDCQALMNVFYCQTEGNDIERIGMLEFSRAEDTWQYGSKHFRVLSIVKNDLVSLEKTPPVVITRLKGSYQIMINHFIEKCKSQHVDIKLNWEAKSVTWGADSISSVSNKETEAIFGDFIVVTVPLQVLKEGAVQFIPDIIEYKKEALDCMEMRNGCKIFCCFNEAFWPSSVQVVFCEQQWSFTQVWTEDSFTHNNISYYILCGFCTATAAEEAAKMEREDLKDQFLAQLDIIFGRDERRQPATDSFVNYYFYDWGSNPFARGCYASPVVNSYAMAEKLAEPLGQKLFFAGEATNTTGMSTVQSAIDSGKRAANEIVRTINKCK